MILLRLLNPKLQYVPYGKGKVHARWNGLMSTTGVDISIYTLCGRTITDEMRPLREQEVDTERLCGNCYRRLRTYGPQVELVSESEVGK